MPKVSLPALPLSGLFGVMKPSGPTSMSVIHDIQQLVARSKLFVAADKLEKMKGKKIPNKGRGKQVRENVKIGQGGTLDPLADGVLVIGINKGTKKLSEFLSCTKDYRSTCLLGCETDTYDSEGARVRLAPWKHVTRGGTEAVLSRFTGDILQTPPIFSALKMDGKPLYEYARQGIPLPRPIEPRRVTVHSLKIVEWKGSDHTFRWPERSLSKEEKEAVEKAFEGTNDRVSLKDDIGAETDTECSSAFVLEMTVSGGTYVRSIAHDVAHAVGSAGHVVTLTRSRQGRFCLEPTQEGDRGCVPWEVFEKALSDPGEADEDGWTDWEREVIDRLEIVDDKKQ